MQAVRSATEEGSDHAHHPVAVGPSLLTACASTRDSASITQVGSTNYQFDTEHMERVNRSVRGGYVDVIWVNPPTRRQVAASGETP